MSTPLKGKVLTVIGGNGYVGSAICKNALLLGAKVYAISRSGNPKTQSQWTSQVNWVKGSAMNPQPYEKILSESDAIVHSLGTLFDTSLTQFRKPGEEGTYEQVNRDTARILGDKISELKANKKVVYLSAAHSIPFISRYLQAKLEAEDYLFNLPNIRTTALRPGFIYDKHSKPWSVPLKYGVNTYASIYKGISSMVPYNSFMKDILKYVEIDYAIDLESVAISAIAASFNSKYDGKILENQDMISIKNDYGAHGLSVNQS